MNSVTLKMLGILLCCVTLQACAFEDDGSDYSLESYHQTLQSQGAPSTPGDPIDIIDGGEGDDGGIQAKKYCGEPHTQHPQFRTCRDWDGVPYVVGEPYLEFRCPNSDIWRTESHNC